ncbi:VCBS repeat-containing protein [bacterium]|nr:VCBS repeat-containing protein [bacterium]
MFRTRKPVTRVCPPSYRRGLRLEWLEARDVPATLFVDDGLVAGTALGSLPATVSVTNDRDASGTLTDGDQVSIAVGETGTTTALTFRTSAAGVAAGGDAGVAFNTIQLALDAAAGAGFPGADTVAVAKGTYAESLTVSSAVTLDGLTGVAADVTIDPAAGAGITVSADGVTIQDLSVTGATDGVVATAAVGTLTLANVVVGDNPATGAVETNTGIGLNLTGSGAAGSTLTLTNVRVAGNATQGLAVSGFETVNLTGLSATAAAGATASSITLPAASAAATLNIASTATAAQTFTVTGTSLQIGPTGGTAGEAITLANVDVLNLTGGTGADTFVVTPAATGGAAIVIAGGTGGADTIDLTTTTGLTVAATYSVTGFAGSVTSGATAAVNFSGVESFADGSTITGRAFVDTDNDGTIDAAEGGLAGVTVFLEADADNALDAGELTAVTDSTGAFSFTGLPPGSYSVRVVAPSGATLTTSATPAAVTVATLGQTGLAPVNFGFDLATGGTVTGVLFGDTNGNGTQNGGENPIAGATVYLDLDGDAQLDANEPSAVTGATGAFTLNTTSDGTFTLRAAAPLPAGFALPATPPTVSLSAGGSVTRNLGLIPTGGGTTGGTVSGVVFADVVAQNGVRDAGENGVRGVTVYLDLDNDGRLDAGEPTDVTDATGAYSITTTQDVTGASVRALLSPGYLRSTSAPVVTLTGGAAVTGQDIGLIANLPPQATPSRRLAAGFIIGGRAHVKTFGPDGHELSDTVVFPGLNLRDVRVAVADVTGDGVDDVIVGTGPGVPAVVVVLDGTNLQEVARLTPFEAGFTGGVFVAAGDVTGDGVNDIIVTPDEGGGPRLVVYQGGMVGATGTFTQVASFFGIEDVNFRGGARVAVADVNRDGIPDLIVAAGFGGGPRVAVYNGASVLSGLTRLFNDFFVFELTLRNGAFITAGDIDGDGFADLIAGGGPGGGPRVLALSGAGLVAGQGADSAVLANYFAGDDKNRGGVRLTAKDTDGDGKVEIFTGSGEKERGRTRRFRGNGQDDGFDIDFGGNSGVFVG